MRRIPFNRPQLTGREYACISEAVTNLHLAGNGPFTRKAQRWLEQRTGAPFALLTQSCTAALEMSALLAGIGSGDEVIMPSFTFVSTANAFVLRGATPVFVDVRPDTLNLDERLIEPAITARTKAIVAVHYSGIACDMDAILKIAARHGLLVIEDAAQALLSTYRGRPLGTFGQLGALSFHETKNVTSGEGGALLVNDPQYVERAEIIWEKGTNRSKFFRGQVDKYTWVDLGSSYLPSEVTAAFLWAQFEEADAFTAARLRIWHRYHESFAGLEADGLLRRPIVPDQATHNAHLYYLLFPDLAARTAALSSLNGAGVNAVFHYIPLHGSPAGRRYGRTCGSMKHTDAAGDRLLRLPLWAGMTDEDVATVVEAVRSHVSSARRLDVSESTSS
jgi:dTDP-4-amino-4,6-dideoxygalactose transaminase